MISNIPPEITITSFSLLSILAGYVWRNQDSRICKLELELDKLPLNDFDKSISQIINDIKWIKQFLNQKKW